MNLISPVEFPKAFYLIPKGVVKVPKKMKIKTSFCIGVNGPPGPAGI